jgi:hypothetical protein
VRADGPFASPAFSLVLLFAGIIVVPAALYLYVAHPAWAWLYLVDPAAVPALALVPLLVLHGGALILAWYAAARLLRSQKERAVRYAIAGALVVVLGALLLRARLLHYGTYRDYRDGSALPIMDVKLGYALVALFIGGGTSAGFVALELLRDARRVRAR